MLCFVGQSLSLTIFRFVHDGAVRMAPARLLATRPLHSQPDAFGVVESGLLDARRGELPLRTHINFPAVFR